MSTASGPKGWDCKRTGLIAVLALYKLANAVAEETHTDSVHNAFMPRGQFHPRFSTIAIGKTIW